MNDPREELLSSLDNTKTRIVRSPGFIVVCGGPIDVAAGRELCSVRNIFLARLSRTHADLSGRLLLPEQFVEWNHHGVYKDLLGLETDLAHLTSAVVIFVESPGSIAELGSFSCIPELAQKVIAVLRKDHYEVNSFIRWGPVKYLEDTYPSSVFVYAWRADNSNVDSDLPDFIQGLQDYVSAPSKTESFKSNDVKHVLLLLADLVDLFVVVRRSELKEWLSKHFAIELDDAKLNRYLYLLTKLGLVVEVPYGKNRFFVAPKNSVSFVEYGTKDGGFSQERSRMKARIVSFFGQAERTRISALKAGQQHTLEKKS